MLKSKRERCCKKGTFPKIFNIWWERQRVGEGEYIRSLYAIRIEQKWKGCSLRRALISSGMSARTRINTCGIVLGALHLMKKSGRNLGMRGLVRPQHAQDQGELPKFRSSCQSCGHTSPEELVPPQGPSQGDPSGSTRLVLDTVCALIHPVPPVQSYSRKGHVLGHPSSPAGSSLQLAQITPEQMGQVCACIPQLRAREEYSD